MKRLFVAMLAAAALTACAPVVQAGGLTTETSDFTVQARPGTWRSRPVVEGYVYNKRAMRATRVLLRVDALDAAGAVVASEIRHLDREIGVSDRVYFDVTPPAAAPAYRVSVEYVFWRDRTCGG
jgi:hypothetical protein